MEYDTREKVVGILVVVTDSLSSILQQVNAGANVRKRYTKKQPKQNFIVDGYIYITYTNTQIHADTKSISYYTQLHADADADTDTETDTQSISSNEHLNLSDHLLFSLPS